MARRIEDFHALYFKISVHIAEPRDAQFFGYQDMIAAYRTKYGNLPYSEASVRFDAGFKGFRHNFWKGRGNDYNLDDSAARFEDEDNLKQHFLKALAQPMEAKQKYIPKVSLSACQGYDDMYGCDYPFGDGDGGVTLLHLVQELYAWDRAE